MTTCEVCGESCHGLPDGSPRCLKHLPESSTSPPRVPSPGSAASFPDPLAPIFGRVEDSFRLPEERIP